ncbi:MULTISPECIES: hypothetical protein [Cryobacterium]|uniref:Uncharacterized protein n=2 Tax=Cryobacterium levicorallinum TaxID=995038 RepID=A0A4R8VND8_9MICO|nr:MULTISPECIES: hypothetical protein [Cryobacterium]TFB86058.1 hypothetical protein E3O11_06060 [Cryobacterium levicorallinum]TFD60349.1 hypothetical protein E3T41_08685 [Cryobacterium sp. Hh38]GEP27583.1 hypothetical protein CLE01_21810 [Cryobacterium levicorallinum]
MKLMLKRNKAIIGAGGVAVALTMALAALGPTGAYFSDTEQGSIDGTKGSIKIAGVDSLDLHFTNMLPGEMQTVSERYVNNGLSPQDVWVVFNNAEALHALNDEGTFMEFHLSANGTALFDSANLNDNGDGVPGCAGFDPAGCWPLERAYKLQENLAPGSIGKVSFSAMIAAKAVGQSEVGGGDWLPYPVKQQNGAPVTPTDAGLPYQIVATQVGQEPGH